MKFLLSILIVVLSLSSCIEQPNSYSELPPGPWRVYLKLTDPEAELPEVAPGEVEKITDYFELPFNMEVSYDESRKMHVAILNGDERLEVHEVHYGRDPSTAKDTILFNLTEYDVSLEGYYEENTIEGYYVVHYKDNYRIPFVATYGQDHRFIKLEKPFDQDISGDWKMMFEYDNEHAYPALGEFKQEGNHLTGTIRTETGDYRYLAGNVYDNKLRLSVFDGAHAFLFSGSISQDTIYGEFRSGKHYKSKWYALRDSSFSLENPYNMTKADDAQEVAFSFPDPTGNTVSLDDEQFQNKIKLINIMGTWCPNCKDEIEFLKEVKTNNPEANLEIVTIAFERYRDIDKANAMLTRYKDALGFDWPILLGGYASKKETTEKFPFLDRIYSYPTLLMVDRENNIRHIHTGFNGPATSKYDSFKKDFDSKLQKLLSE